MSINLLNTLELTDLKKAYLSKIFSRANSTKVLLDILTDALNLEGSLVRAQISFKSVLARGGSNDAALNLACGIEYFHLASLLLDDLPCMNNALERRGAECLHLKYGEANTILAALSLINRSYTLFYSVVCKLESDVQEKCIELIDSCLGLEGIVSGQALDLNFKYKGNRDNLDIRHIAYLKTSSLFKLCISLPALATGANDLELKYLNRLSLFAGIAYQVIDDFRDLSLIENFKEKTARDKELSRPNILIALGTSGAFKYLERVMSDLDYIISKLDSISPSNEIYSTIVSYFRSKYDKISELSSSEKISQEPSRDEHAN